MNSTELIKELSSRYHSDTLLAFGKQRSNSIITKDLQKSVSRLCNINENKYKVYGSAGTGNWSEIPWLAILDKEITVSTRKGYYIVLLFDKDIKNIFICLGVGWMQFEEEYGAKDGKMQINSLCRYYANLLMKDHDGFISGNVPLNASNSLGKGYEASSILYKKHTINNLTDDLLRDDIDELIGSYQDLRDIVGDSILNVEVDTEKYDEQISNFKRSIAKTTFKQITDESIERLIIEAESNPPSIKEKLIKQIPRNRKYSLYIKQKANFICSVCGREPFMQKNGQPYAEADHVNPLGLKGDDSPKNMRCLCAQCHSVITYGSDEEIQKLLSIKIM